MLDLVAVRSLIAVRDHGSVVDAAEALGFTPSAISQQIKRLERQSGCLMLERVGRGVILSERGRMLADQGRRLLADMEALENTALGVDSPASGELRVAVFSTASRGVIAPLLERLASSAPALMLTTHEVDPRECLGLVERGGADMGIVHDWNTVPLDLGQALESVHLFTDIADLLLNAEHPLAGAASVEPTQLLDERWISNHEGSICDDWLNQMFALHRARPDIRYRDDSFESHVAFVQRGVAVALVPRLGRMELPDGVVAVPVRNPEPRRHVYSVWRHASVGNPARRHVQEQLELVVAELDPMLGVPVRVPAPEPVRGPVPVPVSSR
jgi:DNA-binding transcriptional LysR family regulator